MKLKTELEMIRTFQDFFPDVALLKAMIESQRIAIKNLERRVKRLEAKK